MNDTLDANEYGGSEFYFSPFVKGEIHISDRNRLFKSGEGKSMFFSELVI